MKYEGVCLSVKDINKARTFYEEVFGLEVQQDYGINITFGGVSLQQEFDWLIGMPKDQIKVKSNNMELYFEEEDLDGFINKLQTRNDVEYIGSCPMEARWGQRYVRFYDLDGHIIEVGEKMKITIQRFLDSGMSMEETSVRMDVSIPDLITLLES